MASIFIPFAFQELQFARDLEDLLRARGHEPRLGAGTAFQIAKSDIRCTSVHPYTLNAGARTSERLRSEIREAEIVIGLLSPVAADSKYVLAELGAAWGQGVPTFPLRVKSATFEHIPEPLNERHSLSLESQADCEQLVDDIADATTLKRKEASKALEREIRALRAAAGSDKRRRKK